MDMKLTFKKNVSLWKNEIQAAKMETFIERQQKLIAICYKDTLYDSLTVRRLANVFALPTLISGTFKNLFFAPLDYLTVQYASHNKVVNLHYAREVPVNKTMQLLRGFLQMTVGSLEMLSVTLIDPFLKEPMDVVLGNCTLLFCSDGSCTEACCSCVKCENDKWPSEAPVAENKQAENVVEDVKGRATKNIMKSIGNGSIQGLDVINNLGLKAGVEFDEEAQSYVQNKIPQAPPPSFVSGTLSPLPGNPDTSIAIKSSSMGPS
jgi:hypothetical protein